MYLQSFIFLRKNNIKIFLLILSFYMTIVQTLSKLMYLVLANLLILLLLFAKDLCKLFLKKHKFLFYTPILFFLYVIISFFFFQEEISNTSFNIIGSYLISIIYFYIFSTIKIETIQNEIFKYLLFFNTFIVLLVFFSKFQSEFFIISTIQKLNFHELFSSLYFHMIINIITILLIIRNFNKFFLSVSLLGLILSLFITAELKNIFFLLSFVIISFLFNYKNKYTVINSFIIFFIFFSLIPFKYSSNEDYKYFSTYNLSNRIQSFYKEDYLFISNYEKVKETSSPITTIDPLIEIDDHIKLDKSLTSRYFSYKKFFYIIKNASGKNLLFGQGVNFNYQFYYHNLFLDIFIKHGLFGLIFFIFPIIFLIRNYFFIAKENLFAFLQSYHFCFIYLLYIHLISFASWNTKFLFSFISISYLLINKKKNFK